MDASTQVLDTHNTVELLLATTRDAVFTVELEGGCLVQANEHLELLTGFPLETLLGAAVEVLSPAEVPGRERPMSQSILQQVGLHEEVAMARADGFTAIATLRVAHVEQDNRTLAVCIARDETERRMLERELITKHVALLGAHRDLEARRREIGDLSQRLAAVSKRAMLAEIVAEVAHALNNPLGALISSLRLLEKIPTQVAEKDQPRYARALTRCRSLSDRLARVVEDLRVTCREGTSAFADAHCDLASQVRSAMAVVEHRIPKGVDVEVHTTPANALTPADEVHHAIVNLLSNALEAVGSQGKIAIVCGAEAGCSFVRVDDDGPGIAQEHVNKIFDPFFSTKPKHQGTGVGLSMIRRMAMLYGGSVTAEPNGVLGGASFRIELPGGQPCTA